jgi:hypothetical protein
MRVNLQIEISNEFWWMATLRGAHHKICMKQLEKNKARISVYGNRGQRGCMGLCGVWGKACGGQSPRWESVSVALLKLKLLHTRRQSFTFLASFALFQLCIENVINYCIIN